MSETAISKAIRVAIKRLFPQLRMTRLQTGLITARHGAKIHCAEPGWPDLIGYDAGGRFFAIEVKKADGKLSPEQVERIADIKACGGVAIVAYGVLDAVTQIKIELEAIK